MLSQKDLGTVNAKDQPPLATGDPVGVLRQSQEAFRGGSGQGDRNQRFP